jgi:hypothetical protein
MSCGAPGCSGGNAQGSGWRDGPRRSDGDARRKRAHGQSRRAATLTLLDVPLHIWRRAVRCLGRVVPSRPEQRNNVARSSEGQPFTTGMNAWPGLSRLVQVPTWRPAVLHRRKRRRLLSTVALTALAAVFSTPCDAVFSRSRDRSLLPIASRAGNDRNANARSTGLHGWLDDQTLMKAVSAMLTDCSLSIAPAMRDFKLS